MQNGDGKMWSAQEIELATTINEMVLDSAREMVEDTQKKGRLKASECQGCFYSRRVVGHGFTAYICKECEKEHMHHDTGTPKLCKECANKLNVCHQCGGKK